VIFGEVSATPAVVVEEVDESETLMPSVAKVEFALVIVTKTVAESFLLVAAKVCVRVAVTESDDVEVKVNASSASKLSEEVVTTALEGATDTNPKPKAATARTAVRLRNVSFDITFLSIVVIETLSMTAGKDLFFAS